MRRLIAHVGGSQGGARIGEYEIPAAVARGGWAEMYREIQADIRYLRDEGNNSEPEILFHNPFCYQVGSEYEFDQFQEAQRAGLPTADAKGFREMGLRLRDDGVRVWAYLGHFHEPDFQNHLLKDKPGTWVQKIIDNCKVLLDAKMSIGLDAVAGLVEGTPEYEVIDLLRSCTKDYGGDCAIECRPSRSCPNLHDWTNITNEGFWRTMEQQLAVDGDRHWAQPKEGITGRIIRWAQTPAEGIYGWWTDCADRWLRDVAAIQAEGHTAIFPLLYPRMALAETGDQKYRITQYVKDAA